MEEGEYGGNKNKDFEFLTFASPESGITTVSSSSPSSSSTDITSSSSPTTASSANAYEGPEEERQREKQRERQREYLTQMHVIVQYAHVTCWRSQTT